MIRSAKWWAHAAVDGTAALVHDPGHLAGLTGVLTGPMTTIVIQNIRCGMHAHEPQIASAFVYICAHGVHASSSPGVPRGEERETKQRGAELSITPVKRPYKPQHILYAPSARQPALPQRTLCCPRAAVAPAAGQPAECDFARSLRAKPQPLHTTTTGSGLQSD